MKDWLKVFRVAPSAVFVVTNESGQPGGQLRVRLEARVFGATASHDKSFESVAAAGEFFDLVDKNFVEQWWRDLNEKVAEEFEGFWLRGEQVVESRGLRHA
ncbi:hypothetical protein NJC11_29500 [Pseudomonas aeruginosa]|uniref:hypothetical protein n=1 Tax=Pseudomonas aeruginosa TaxID=287 RepID=UPI00209AB572|nr:hypothetical protein [Pseudomonas aeruginosa]MCO7655635.1 hypothetical protein [Pseudomonas aeruginosa]